MYNIYKRYSGKKTNNTFLKIISTYSTEIVKESVIELNDTLRSDMLLERPFFNCKRNMFK